VKRRRKQIDRALAVAATTRAAGGGTTFAVPTADTAKAADANADGAS
jgi:hypothetical protein